MPKHDDEQFRRAQARYDEMEQPDDDIPTDEDILDFCWREDPPHTRTQAAAAVQSARGGMASIVRR